MNTEWPTTRYIQHKHTFTYMLIYSIFRYEVSGKFAFVSSVWQADKWIVLMSHHDSILIAVRGNRHRRLVSASDDAVDIARVQAVQSIVRFTGSALC